MDPARLYEVGGAGGAYTQDPPRPARRVWALLALAVGLNGLVWCWAALALALGGPAWAAWPGLLALACLPLLAAPLALVVLVRRRRHRARPHDFGQ